MFSSTIDDVMTHSIFQAYQERIFRVIVTRLIRSIHGCRPVGRYSYFDSERFCQRRDLLYAHPLHQVRIFKPTENIEHEMKSVTHIIHLHCQSMCLEQTDLIYDRHVSRMSSDFRLSQTDDCICSLTSHPIISSSLPVGEPCDAHLFFHAN